MQLSQNWTDGKDNPHFAAWHISQSEIRHQQKKRRKTKEAKGKGQLLDFSGLSVANGKIKLLPCVAVCLFKRPSLRGQKKAYG